MKFVIIILLAVLSFPSNSQVFTWKDEQGVTHFGDRVPDKYKTESKHIEVKANVVETVKLKAPVVQTPAVETPAVETTSAEAQTDKVVDEPTKKKHLSREEICRLKWDKYNWSQQCIKLCGADTSNFSGSGLGRKLKCGCERLSKPKCEI